MPQDTPSRKLDQYIVRFPDGMRERLKDAAAGNGRSLNAEIIFRLDSSFATKGRTSDKLKAIADGTFVPEPKSLDIFSSDGFDPFELKRVLSEMAVRMEVMSSKLDVALDLKEDAADAAIFAERMASVESGEHSLLPAEVSAAVHGGTRLLTAIREWRGLTVAQLAKQSSMKVAGLKELESGAAAPTDLEAEQLAKVLEVPINWIAR